MTLPQNKVVATFNTAKKERTARDSRGATKSLARETKDAKRVQFDLSRVEVDKRDALQALLDWHSQVFASSNLDVGRCGVIKHRIVTGDSPPVYQRAYRISYSQREEMERQVHELIDHDIVEHLKSPWGGARSTSPEA